ncbi:MAG: pyridoxamine 5'-phosphate oxidase family protein [Betaproteobacteria bacterium]
MSQVSGSVVEPADPQERRDLWKRLADLEVAMLTTRDVDGELHARPVQPVRVEEGRIWFFTSVNGGIAHDIARDVCVHLAFVDHDGGLYASLAGDAMLLRDPVEARALWSTTAGVWYPGGPDDPSLGLLRIDVHRADYWDVKESRPVQFFRLAAAAVTGRRPDDVAVHRQFRT